MIVMEVHSRPQDGIVGINNHGVEDRPKDIWQVHNVHDSNSIPLSKQINV